MFDTWDRLPHLLQAFVLGNLIEWGTVAVLRVARVRFPPIGPLLDRVGPKAVRDPHARRASAGCAVAVAWFVLSIVVGHEAIHLKRLIVGDLLHR